MSASNATVTSSALRVAVAGASGLIGRELVQLLSADSSTAAAFALVRRPSPQLDAVPGVQPLLVDFNALEGQLSAIDEAFCCLGTTIKAAGSQAAFRAVDFDAVLSFARAARAAGARRFAVVSALGADAKSAVFYNRVKGEMEAAVAELSFDSTVIARPSLLVGDRAALGQPVRFGERLATVLTAPLGGLIPKSVRPIRARVVALGLLRALREARPGLRVVESAELQSLGQ